MLIYNQNNITYCYIHIPKNSGKYFRNKIKEDKTTTIIKSYWDIKGSIDLAHIPFMFRHHFINILKLNVNDISYFAHTRNPYDRIISAYFYRNPGKCIQDFKLFVNNDLVKMIFHKNFDKNIIHYYPQYLFICANNLELSHVKTEKIEDVLSTVKRYNLPNYYDNNIIQIINKIYELDFKYFDYELIQEI
jgi:hypothetical protein